VGTWEPERDWAKDVARINKMTGSNLTVEDAIKVEKQRMESSGDAPVQFTYGADGTFVMQGMIFDHVMREESRWLLVEPAGDRVVVEVEDRRPDHKGERERTTFVFEEPDLVRIDDGLMRGTKYRRVK
jgi:hypothetical protein